MGEPSMLPLLPPSPPPVLATTSFPATASQAPASFPLAVATGSVPDALAIPAPRPWTVTLDLAPPSASGSLWLLPLGASASQTATLSVDPDRHATLTLPLGIGSLTLPGTVTLPAQATGSIATDSLDVELPGLPPPPPAPEVLTLLHTADTYGVLEPVGYDQETGQVDLHATSQAGGKVRLAEAIAEERATDANLLLFSAGNELGPDAEAAVDQGKQIVQAMNVMGYDAWSPSTYDFAYGLDALQQRISEARFPIISSNVRWTDTGSYLGDRYRIFHRGGLSIAVLGLADPESADLLPAADRNRIQFQDPLQTVRELVPRIRRQDHPDLVIVLAHLPERTTERLLVAGSGADIVLGGFSSHRSGDQAITELTGMRGKRAYSPGTYGLSLGRVNLSFDAQSDESGRRKLVGTQADNLLLDGPMPGDGELAERSIEELVNRSETAFHDTWKARLGVVPALAEELPPGAAMRFVGEAMRLHAGTEIAALSRQFFLDDGDFDPVGDIQSLYADMPWDDGLVTLTLSGDQLSDLYDSVSGDDAGLLVGVTADADGNLSVNGRPLNENSYYSVVALSSLVSPDSGDFSDLANGANRRNLGVSAREALLAFLRHPTRRVVETGAVDLSDFPNYQDLAFWKSTLTVDVDFSDRQIAVDPTAYPDLPWNNDQSDLSWGGEVLYRLGSTWGRDEADGKLDLDYEQDSVAGSPPTDTTDLIQLEANVSRQQTLLPITTWSGLDLYTRFHQTDPAAPFYMGQISAGLSQKLPLGIKLKEGLSYRKLFFDPLQRYGPLFRFEWQHPFPWVVVDSTLDVLGSPTISQDDLLTDLEAKLTIPISSWVGISLKESWYDDTLVPMPATRTLLGLSFSLTHPWVPPSGGGS